MNGMLSGYRALDLTDWRGWLCGRVLADMGVEVTKVEPPGGDPDRMRGPFYHDEAHPEKSLWWWAYNQGKKSITLDLEATPGKELFQSLVTKTDFLIESFPPGHMEGLGLGYGDIQTSNPALIWVSVTPFGQDGPYRDYRAPDIVTMALGGFMSLTGDPDRAPLRLSFPVSHALASLQGALGALVAFHHRQATEQGQFVDVSAQESVTTALLNAIPMWDMNRVLIQRTGRFRSGLSSGVKQRQVWPCRDGSVAYLVVGGLGGAKSHRALVKWMEAEGMGDEFLRSIDWDQFDMATASREFHTRVEESFGNFFLAHTKLELHHGAVDRGIWLQLVSSPRDIAESTHLSARDFWTKVPHPEVGESVTYPGPFVRATASPVQASPRAPLVGEHNHEVYEEVLGLSAAQVAELKEKGVI
jgi:crotonobetainyl-CoA:carnitine CoA-transferase CaiB-like acyl-CoA transferase